MPTNPLRVNESRQSATSDPLNKGWSSKRDIVRALHTGSGLVSPSCTHPNSYQFEYGKYVKRLKGQRVAFTAIKGTPHLHAPTIKIRSKEDFRDDSYAVLRRPLSNLP